MDNGENIPQPEQQDSRKRAVDRINDLANTARSARSNAQSAQRVYRRVKTVVTAVRTGATLANPVSGTVIAIFVAILIAVVFFLVLFSDGSSRPNYDDYYGSGPSPVPGTDPGTSPDNPLPGLNLLLNEPAPVENGESVTLTIDVSYSGSQAVEVLANLPSNFNYVTSNGIYDPNNRLVRWNLLSIPPEDKTTGEASGMPQSKIRLYNSYGFPNPTDPIQLSDGEKARWNNYMKPAAELAAGSVGVDLGIIGMWFYLEHHFDPFAENCYKEADSNQNPPHDGNPNTDCPFWGGLWQVNGLHMAHTIHWLKEAIEQMHPGRTWQSIAQDVITASSIRQASTEPITTISVSAHSNTSIDQLIEGANNEDQSMRNLVATIYKDDRIGAYLIAKHFKQKGLDDGLAVEMRGWDTYNDYYNPQRIINIIAGIYDSGSITKSYNLFFTVQPTSDDFKVPNYTVSARYITSGNNQN